MDAENRKAPAGAEANQEITSGETSSSNLPKPKKFGKHYRMLSLFAEGVRLNRFEAASYGDSCLNSTIPSLQSRYGLYFSRERVRVPNRFGSLTPCNDYWLEGKSLETARKVCGIEG